MATLPDYSTGTISFTFIPDDSAAANGPTQYMIGGTFGFTDPSGGAVTVPVFPATITVDPQAELQLNYFLQKDVVDPSEPATLGLLVTNVGGGTANNLSITTAQPQIVQNAKGLLDTFQIVGTQVGIQPETPSLTVDFGDIAPGQTADASFLLLSSLPGEFDNFTATFSHSDALGGTETSLIEQRDDAHLDPRRRFQLSRQHRRHRLPGRGHAQPREPARHDLLLGRDDRRGQHRDRCDVHARSVRAAT